MSVGATIRLSCMAKDVSRLTKVLASCRPLPLYPPSTAHSVALQCRSHCQQPSLRFFSQSISTQSSRFRQNRDVYPGFRNESKEHRNVREHNLFDPELRHLNISDDFSGPSNPTRPPGTVPLDDTLPSDTERELLFLSSQSPTDPRVRNVLLHLIYDKAQPPNATQYEALILANASPEYGSADNVQNLIEEMEELDIPMNVNLYSAILRTLVVHPDIDVLNDVIEACENQWIEIDSEMRHLICAAYLRAGMPEIALDYLERLENDSGGSAFGVTTSGLQRGQAELWLYVLFVQELAEQNDWEGVMRLCYRLCDDTSYGIPLASRHFDIPYQFWLSLLEKASSARDEWVSFWIWENWVLKAWVRPSPETCLDVLEICAGSGAIRIAETASVILRFVSKERSERSPAHEVEAQALSKKRVDTVKALLARTYENAPPNESRPSQTEVRRMTGEWWIFDVEDKIGLDLINSNPRRSLRINPWAMLREINDPGLTWARKLDQREAATKKRGEREALRKAHVRRAKVEAGYATMRKSLPATLLADIERAATAEPGDDGTDETVNDQSSQQSKMKTSSKKITQRSGRQSIRGDGTEDEVMRPRIRLIDPKTRNLNPPIENEKIRQWLTLGLDVTTALKMDNQKGNRAWKLGDEDDENEIERSPVPDSTNASKPGIRLFKLPETSLDEQWYSEWSRMVMAKNRFERAERRKKHIDGQKDAARKAEDGEVEGEMPGEK